MGMRTHIALLRGINVGGKNIIRMAELKQLFIELGYESVVTLLQSGNVVFRATGQATAEIEQLLSSETMKRMSLEIPYLVRSAEELTDVIGGNPFRQEAESDPSHLLVHFTWRPPLAFDIDRVQAHIRGPERIAGGARHLYVLYPDGIGTSTIGRTPGWNQLVSASTARNWNTILKMDRLVRE